MRHHIDGSTGAKPGGALGLPPIWKLEAALKCRSCKKGRYAPPVHMIKLTREREIMPHVWIQPDEEGEDGELRRLTELFEF